MVYITKENILGTKDSYEIELFTINNKDRLVSVFIRRKFVDGNRIHQSVAYHLKFTNDNKDINNNGIYDGLIEWTKKGMGVVDVYILTTLVDSGWNGLDRSWIIEELI